MNMAEKKLSRSEWLKTPYAKSDAKNPDGAIQALLAKYGVVEVMTASYLGVNKRPGFGVRFVLKGKPYRVALETLNADASPDELRVQVKRAVFHYLKSVLEVTGVFMSVEEALFAYLELPTPAGDGLTTMFEYARPTVNKLTAPDFGKLMLPPASRSS
jgi:hypothetical protein